MSTLTIVLIVVAVVVVVGAIILLMKKKNKGGAVAEAPESLPQEPQESPAPPTANYQDNQNTEDSPQV